MGLDMYAFSVPASAVKGDFDVNTEFKKEVQYWRKHNALHSWMENLYRAKGGDAESFNCIPVRLTKEDLNALIEDAKGYKLESATGFFWGSQYDYNDEIANQDIEFAQKALWEITLSGNAVYYDSWW
jgi:hypothetical protein